MKLNYEILIQSDFSSMKIVRPETNLFSIITIQNNQGKRITIQNCGVDVTEYDVLKLIELNNNNLKKHTTMTTNAIQPQPKKVTKFTDKLNSELTKNYLSKLYDRLDEVKNHLHRNRLANHLSFITNAK